eukprot:scaffold558_cov120-Isochrysis_galbana.AAC.8
MKAGDRLRWTRGTDLRPAAAAFAVEAGETEQAVAEWQVGRQALDKARLAARVQAPADQGGDASKGQQGDAQ